MLARDPSLRLIAVGDNDMAWNRTVLGRAGAHIDYLSIHHYYGLRESKGEYDNLMARPLLTSASIGTSPALSRSSRRAATSG